MTMQICTTKGTFSNGKMPCILFSAAFSPKLLFSAIRHPHDQTSLPTSSTRQTLGSRSWSTTGKKQTSSQRLLSSRISLCVKGILSATTRFQLESFGVYSKPSSVSFPRMLRIPNVQSGWLAFKEYLRQAMSIWTIIYVVSTTCH